MIASSKNVGKKSVRSQYLITVTLKLLNNRALQVDSSMSSKKFDHKANSTKKT